MSDTSHAEYWASVASHAESVLEREQQGEDASDVLHEECDSSWWVIYTHAAMAVLQHSPNEDAIFESMGDDALSGCTCHSEVMTRMAFFALEQDVAEAAEELRDAAVAS